ncbi:MAG TPA: DPP IV N-terminal domain-containing protein, partial [Thermomicrobiales bacterium]|nr:DPP IV N-terminal domain-containing protein [Thermomicrobiales bacterium]
AWAEYARAEQFLPWNVKTLVFNVEVTPHWLGESDRFWYRRTGRAGAEFILVDPATAERRPAFDHVRLAAALSRAAGAHYLHNRLPFDELEFVEDDRAIRFAVAGTTWTCDLETYECAKGEAATKPAKDELRSPDGKWAAFVRDGNLWLRATDGGAERQLTRDAEPYHDYATLPESRLSAITDRAVGKPLPPAALWSPDSAKILTYRLDQREVRPMHLVQSVPPPGTPRPALHTYRYPLPGDEHLPGAALMVFDAASGAATPLAAGSLTVVARSPFEQKTVWWSADGARVYVVHPARDGRSVALQVADAATGETRTILEECGPTQVFPHHVQMESSNVREVGGGEAVTWFSSRDGWGHLYLYDAHSGELRHQLTAGAWTVRDVARVDDREGRLYFTAGGREAGRDPYYRHLYRCKLDGAELELLTPEDAEHTVAFSPTGAYFVDTFSRVDQAPATVLRAADGRLVCPLEEADLSALLATGWRFPERFSVKARDGVTDLYGMLIRPSRYDPTRHYPVLDAIYPGPQTIRTPKAFPPANNGFWQDQALAELGFIVVTIDGQGTPYRSKAFHDVAYGAAFGEAGGLADHVAGLRQLAARDPSLDLDRVGIYGHSGGGYASTRAMLRFPDFYRVAVSSAGNHDQRGYNATWGERWIGAYDADAYAHQDNISLAGNLKGKLLLVHGELDDNVHPSLTLRLVDALIAANKDFDLLIVPNTNHALFDTRRGLKAFEQLYSQGHPYFVRKRWDYFVRHLRGAEPPAGYAIRLPAVE